uniref:Ig-like domain-containing protein n=1 Tax=Maylandia zebra TaxID=106582 RepID=A0A3P9DQQ9_9CICH
GLLGYVVVILGLGDGLTCMYVELGVQNTLICHVTGFYPAPVNITWNKNEQKVTEGTSTSVPFPNKDGSFKQTSRLEFIPKQGDVYSCTVEHSVLALDTCSRHTWKSNV